MFKFIKSNALALWPFFILWSFGLLVVMIFPKGDIHLIINRIHTPFLDVFFKYITWLGSGIMIVLVAFILLFIKVRYSVIYLIGNLMITIIVQLGKHVVYPDAVRPITFFKGVHVLHLVEGVTVHAYHSFPSGHSATAFGILVILLYLTKNKFLKLFWMVFIAVLPNLSRVYLSQHFLEDILAGSMMGLIVMMVTLILFEKYYPLCCNKSVVTLFRKNRGE